MEAGVPLDKALTTIHAQIKSRPLHKVIHSILADLASGETLASSLKRVDSVFDSLAISMVSVGEKTGTLAASLERMAVYYNKALALRGKILGALIYPIIVILGTIGTVIYLVFILLPQITPLFSALNVELPWTTRTIIQLSDFLTENGFFVLGGMIAATGLFIILMGVQSFKYMVHFTFVHTPVLGTLVKKTQVARFSYMLSVLLDSGVKIVEAFHLSADSLDNLVYQRALHKIASSLQEGEDVSTYLMEHQKLFSAYATQMISVGEETGRLSASFESVADFTEKEIDDAVKLMTTLLEPTLMILIGAIVGFVALSVIMPIYELTSGVGA